MTDLLGGLCLLCVTVGLIQYLDREETRRVAEYGAFLDFLRYIRTQIDCYRRPRADLFAAYGNAVLEETGFLPKLRAGGGFAEGFAASRSLLDGQTRELLIAFDRELGSSYTGEQLHACDFYIARLTEGETRIREESPARRKLHRTVTACGGMLVFLLLV